MALAFPTVQSFQLTLTPREKLLIRYALHKLLSQTHLYGDLQIHVSTDLEVRFSSEEISKLCNSKLVGS